MLLSELIEPALRVAIVGLAKNTGKTETLNALLRELRAQGRTVGVTSVGRDGEARDAIDARIEKPSVTLAAGSLVASTDALLRASALPLELVEQTGIRTPLGRVLVARLEREGAVEVAGPGVAEEVRAVADAMLVHGAELVLVDGAIDRRAASSPAVCDGIVLATGAVLAEEPERVAALTRDAVELIRLPVVQDGSVRALAGGDTVLLGDDGMAPVVLPARFALTSTAAELVVLLRAHPRARRLVLGGALCEPFLSELLAATRGRGLELVVADSTRVFLDKRGPGWYRERGLEIRALASLRLCAVTVNPVAPRAHSFDSARLQQLVRAAVPGVRVLDVRSGGR